MINRPYVGKALYISLKFDMPKDTMLESVIKADKICAGNSSIAMKNTPARHVEPITL